MIELRDLQFLSALARHQHFARAAEECGVTQPAFSMRIRKLEEKLGLSIVRRGNRFQGLTEDGQMIVARARGLLEDAKALEQHVQSARGEISGTLTIGTVPTAAAYAARLAMRLNAAYPGIISRIENTTSLIIQARIDDGTIDAGLTYEDGVDADAINVEPLYQERYVLMVPEALAPRPEGTATWAEAAELPLSLLQPQMQNRRILDRTFSEVGVRPRVMSETNALTTSMIMAREGRAATILPDVLISALGALQGVVILPLVDPVFEKTISLVTPRRSPGLPATEALRTVAKAESE